MKKILIMVAAVVLVGSLSAFAADGCCPSAQPQVAPAAPAAQASDASGCAKVQCDKLGACLAKLDLTEEQSKQIAEIRKASGCGEAASAGGCPKAAAAKLEACKKSIMAVLTDEQKTKLAEICAKECAAKKAE